MSLINWLKSAGESAVSAVPGTGIGALFNKLMKDDGEPEYTELKGDERQAAVRFQEQCYLMLNWEKLVLKNKESRVYEQFAILEHERPHEVINTLFKKSEGDLLMNLTTPQLSLLVPKIKLFKEYKEPGREPVTIEMPFDDYMNKHDVSYITSTGVGRGSGVGLKSFTWKTLGTNPANKYSFGAKLVLHFQDIEDLFKIVRTDVLKDGRTIDMSYSDLILPQKKFRKGANEGTFTYSKDYFQIKVLAGWAVPRITGDVGDLFTADELEEIENNEIGMYLGLKSHEFEFGDDGSLDLIINYIAYTESIIAEPKIANILFADPVLEAEKRKYANAVNSLESILKTQEAFDESESNNETIDALKKTISESQEKIEDLENLSKEAIYRRIIKGLLDKKSLYYTYAPKDYFKKKLRVKTVTESYTEEQIKNINKQNEEIKNRNVAVGQVTQNKYGHAVSKTEEEVAIEIEKTEGGLFSDPRLKTLEEFKADVKNFTEISDDLTENSENYRIDFFYLGDLIDVVLEGMFSKNPEDVKSTFFEKEIRIITGPITFWDFGNLVDSGLVVKNKGLENGKNEYDKIYTGKRTVINMADIPISMKTFTAWFLENVIDPGLTEMSFKSFLDKVVNDLVVRSISGECMDFSPKQKARIMYKSFSVPKNNAREELLRDEYSSFKTGPSKNPGIRVKLKDMENTPFTVKVNKKDFENKNVVFENYLLIYGSSEEPYELETDYSKDIERGVYHIYFGNEYGITKRIMYKREDIPYLREANFQNNLPGSSAAGKILREKYNAAIEMVGNNLFEPGGKVFIIPSIMSSGRRDSKMIARRSKIMRDLGIGGYYDIISVESKIEPGVYTTNLEAKWVARGDGKINVGDEEISVLKSSNISNISYSGNVRVLASD